MVRALYKLDFWGLDGFSSVASNNHFQFVKNIVRDTIAANVFYDWEHLIEGEHIDVGWQVSPLIFQDEHRFTDTDEECEVGCCRNFMASYTILNEGISAAVVNILLNACLVEIEHGPACKGSVPFVCAHNDPVIDFIDIDFKVNYEVFVIEPEYVNSQLIQIAAPLLLEKYVSELDNFYSNSTDFVEKFTEMIGKHSNYSQFYTPVNHEKLLEKQKTFAKIQSGLDTEFDSVLNSDGGSFHEELPYIVEVDEIFFTGELINWTTPDPYIESIINYSGFQDYETKNYRNSYDPYHIFEITKLDLLSTLLKLEVLGIKVTNYTENSLIKIDEYQTFDASCFRLDFDQTLKQTDGSDNAISLSLRFPKKISENYDLPYLRTFPRRFYKSKNPISNESVLKLYKSDYYALIYPKSIETPFSTSPEAVKIRLEKSTKIKSFVTKTDFKYRVVLQKCHENGQTS